MHLDFIYPSNVEESKEIVANMSHDDHGDHSDTFFHDGSPNGKMFMMMDMEVDMDDGHGASGHEYDS